MAIGIDDFLLAAASAAGSAAGKQLADDIFNAIFGTLATKDDLAKAVAEIESVIRKTVLIDLETDFIVVQVSASLSALHDSVNQDDPTKKEKSLLDAVATLRQVEGWLDNQLGDNRSGVDFLRVQFVPVVRYIGCQIAVWSSLAFNVSADYKGDLGDHIDQALSLLIDAVSQVRRMETETISSLQVEAHITRENENGGDGGPPIWSISKSFAGKYELFRLSYSLPPLNLPDGVWTKYGPWVLEDSAQALADVQPMWDSDDARANKENSDRNSLIYLPAGEFCDAMTKLRKTLPPSKTGTAMTARWPRQLAFLNRVRQQWPSQSARSKGQVEKLKARLLAKEDH